MSSFSRKVSGARLARSSISSSERGPRISTIESKRICCFRDIGIICVRSFASRTNTPDCIPLRTSQRTQGESSQPVAAKALVMSVPIVTHFVSRYTEDLAGACANKASLQEREGGGWQGWTRWPKWLGAASNVRRTVGAVHSGGDERATRSECLTDGRGS